MEQAEITQGSYTEREQNSGQSSKEDQLHGDVHGICGSWWLSHMTPQFPFFLKLEYSRYTILYWFWVYNMVICQLYALQNAHHDSCLTTCCHTKILQYY